VRFVHLMSNTPYVSFYLSHHIILVPARNSTNISIYIYGENKKIIPPYLTKYLYVCKRE
jgi:hypothetical protein